jgi:glutaminase
MTSHADYTELFSEIAVGLQADPDKLGIHLTTVGNEHFSYGDADERFSIQSIAKVLSLTLALKLLGREVWQRMGVEPSGTSFNSLVQLEYERGHPRNPFINAGAIVICDLLVTQLKDPKRELLDFVRQLSGAGDIDFSPRIAESERQHGYKNYALANLMKSFGNLHNDIDTVLDAYFNLCSIEMSCRELSQTFLFLAANGVNPATGEPVVSPRRAKRINAIMLLCGFYDEAGEFAFRVGLPGKSGVGGGIIAIHPGEYSIAVWSPRLNAKGNSHRGMQLLEALTTRTRSSIFG